jgi:uncharacterized membrane protein YhaH (DUF805 family)
MGIVAYVSKHLRSLLMELCGTAERASFWLAFSNVALILVPLIFALEYTPELGSSKSIVFEMAAQLKYGLVGFVVTLSFLALMLFRFIPTSKPGREANPSR